MSVDATTVEQRLTGQYVKLWPYARGLWPPETLVTLWQTLRAEQAIDKVFYGPPAATGAPYSTHGDVVDFVKFFEPDHGQRVLLMAQSLKRDEVAGIFWFDDFVPGHRAAGGVFYRRRYWGAPAREASRLALGYGFLTLGVRAIWAYTPWKTGRSHAEAVGMRLVATIPEYVVAGGAARDLMVLRVTREEFGDG